VPGFSSHSAVFTAKSPRNNKLSQYPLTLNAYIISKGKMFLKNESRELTLKQYKRIHTVFTISKHVSILSFNYVSSKVQTSSAVLGDVFFSVWQAAISASRYGMAVINAFKPKKW